MTGGLIEAGCPVHASACRKPGKSLRRPAHCVRLPQLSTATSRAARIIIELQSQLGLILDPAGRIGSTAVHG